ncbi:MAG: trypsin-like peptidase domain-containing protein [Burkholderiaceae bacterium]|jgi:S1-C subfamily serine protease|nr:trypsin-like peptidase domain-containing protein [Burkholderiaceae bacterium]
MKNKTLGAFGALFSSAWLALLAVPALHAATLDPAVLPRVQAATFEVVIPKPASESITYEKPLPLELLPFQERNDKYDSVGTAFALDDRHYVTAGHVLELGIGSLTGEPALRDAGGRVYAIGQITRFSLQQDFVEFTLKEPPAIAPLEVNTQPAMNDVVYAVGNALGTGIVIRDGLYTSQTPEDEDGRWKWLRFSAAASPGNSGGPLLDKDGKVIGVVVMKSPSENLNYALPIDQVLNAPANLAVADKRVAYSLDVFDEKHTGSIKMQFALPMSFADFSATFQKLSNENADQMLQALLTENAETLFPRGRGANRVLHGGSDTNPFPALLYRGDNGVWRVARVQPDKSTLSLNGYVSMARRGSQALIHLRKPDDVSSRQLYSDPKLFMNLLLKGMPMKRYVGSEGIKITSLGSPLEEQTLTDAYQRTWQIRIWALPYRNEKVMVLLLPVPDGYVGMLRTASPVEMYENMADLKTLVNFIHLSYRGTLAQWKEYLDNPQLLPAALKDITLRLDYGKEFSYRSGRLEFSYTPQLQAIDKSSELVLGMSYFPDHGKVAWDVSQVAARADANNFDGIISIGRRAAPPDDADDEQRSLWDKLLRRGHPYDGTPYSKNNIALITAVSGASLAADAKPGVLYEVSCAAEGPHPDDAMKDKLKLLLDKLRVSEP